MNKLLNNKSEGVRHHCCTSILSNTSRLNLEIWAIYLPVLNSLQGLEVDETSES